MAETNGRTKRHGGRGVSIKDVADTVEVSTATVSRALRGLPRVSRVTREKVLEAARTLGYVTSPTASGLASGRTKTIGVLAFPGSRWFHSHALDGAAQELSTHNYHLALFDLKDTGNQPGSVLTALQRRVDAVLLLVTDVGNTEQKQLLTIDMPAVSIGGQIQGAHSVGIDDHEATMDAVRHLVRLAHRRIAVLHGDYRWNPRLDGPSPRIRAFQDGMTDAGLDIYPQWTQQGEPGVSGGRKAFVRLWDLPGERPTAVLCTSDEMATGVLIEAARIGLRIPEDLSVIGIEDHDFSESYGLTTISQDPGNQARLGIRMLLDELNGEPCASRSVVARHRLEVRSTTSQAPTRLLV